MIIGGYGMYGIQRVNLRKNCEKFQKNPGRF